MTRVVILGGGSAGEAFVGALSRLDGDFETTLVERALVGGECTYWACMPSKTLLRAPEVLAAASQAPGAAEAAVGALDLERIFWWRDQVVESYDDGGHGTWLAERGTALVRGDATVAAPGVLEVEGRELPYDKLVIATGSRPALPPVDGLADAPHWTTANATAASVVPGSLVVVGGGASGVELAQLYQRLGSAGDDRPAQPAADEDGRGGRFAAAGAARGGRRARAVRVGGRPGGRLGSPG